MEWAFKFSSGKQKVCGRPGMSFLRREKCVYQFLIYFNNFPENLHSTSPSGSLFIVVQRRAKYEFRMIAIHYVGNVNEMSNFILHQNMTFHTRPRPQVA